MDTAVSCQNVWIYITKRSCKKERCSGCPGASHIGLPHGQLGFRVLCFMQPFAGEELEDLSCAEGHLGGVEICTVLALQRTLALSPSCLRGCVPNEHFRFKIHFLSSSLAMKQVGCLFQSCQN